MDTHRPQFLCEKLLDENDEEGAAEKTAKAMNLTPTGNLVSSKTSYSSFRPNGSSSEALDTVHEEPKKNKFGISFRRSKSTAANGDDLNTSKHKRSLVSFRRSTTDPSEDDLNTSKHRSSGSLLGELLHSYSLRIRYYPVLLSCSIFFVNIFYF